MADWNPRQYLQFETHRAQPVFDLLNRVPIDAPKRVLDIGCGPGNSTIRLRQHWPNAEIIGIDNSPGMIQSAQEAFPALSFFLRDAGKPLDDLGSFDLVFSNAAFQWIPNHELLLPRCFGLLRPGGCLAVQTPNNDESLLHAAVWQTVSAEPWKDRMTADIIKAYDTPEAYYALLAPLSKNIFLWQTVYYHEMPSHEALLEWHRGTGLRPYLDQLPEAAKADFEADVLNVLRQSFAPQPNGLFLLPFKRLFFTALKG